MEILRHILTSFFPCVGLPIGNLWGIQVVKFMYVLRIEKFCHAVYVMEYKYTDRVTLSLDAEVGMFLLFVLT